MEDGVAGIVVSITVVVMVVPLAVVVIGVCVITVVVVVVVLPGWLFKTAIVIMPATQVATNSTNQATSLF